MHSAAPNPQPMACQPVIYAIPQTILNVSETQRRRSIVNGILQIIVGACCIIVNSVALGIGDGTGAIGHGYWGGVFYIVTGSFGIAAGKKTSKCMMITSMILCIIAASLFTPGHLAASLVATVSSGFELGHYHYSYYYNPDTTFGTQLTLSILAVTEFAFAVWGSTIWCKTIGCCCSTDSQQAMPVQLVQISNGQPIVLMQASGGQYMPMSYTAQPPQYSNYPAPADQGHALPEKVQPNDDLSDPNPGSLGTYQRFA